MRTYAATAEGVAWAPLCGFAIAAALASSPLGARAAADVSSIQSDFDGRSIAVSAKNTHGQAIILLQDGARLRIEGGRHRITLEAGGTLMVDDTARLAIAAGAIRIIIHDDRIDVEPWRRWVASTDQSPLRSMCLVDVEH